MVNYLVTRADGTVTTTTKKPGPRFGMRAPVTDVTITTPGPDGLKDTSDDLTATVTTTRTHEGSNLSAPEKLTTTTVYNDTRTQTSVWDATDRSIVTTTPALRTSTVYLDEKGRIERSVTPGLADTVYAYDERGRLETVTTGENDAARVSTFNYHPVSGYLQSVTDALTRTVSFENDAVGRVKKQILPDLREIGFDYDLDGNLDELTPPERPTHTFEHNPIGQTKKYTPPELSPEVMEPQTTYDYNLDKQLTEIVRPDGKTITFNYHQTKGRLDSIDVDAQNAVTYAYYPEGDADIGKLESVTTADGVGLSYTYDGPLTMSEALSGPVSGTYRLDYNNDFRVETGTVENANFSHSVGYDYDDDGLLTQAGVITLDRNPLNGLLDGTTLNSGDDSFITTRGYNLFGETESVVAEYNGGELYSAVYTRDKLGRIETKTETVEGAETLYEYGYDLAGRLETVKENGILTEQYGYDDNGNRTHLDGNLIGVYDEQDRLESYNGNAYAYTANGELKTKTSAAGTTQYTYDVFGNLKAVNLPGRTIEYMIDGRDRRVGKKIDGVPVQGFLYQGALNPVAELDGDGNLVSVFVYSSKVNVPDYLVKAGKVYRVVSDHLGSVRLVVDMADGAVVQHINYDAFGNVLEDTNEGFQPFGFAGGVYDWDTGLVRFGARDYDAEVGRWTAKDPILFGGGDSNLYGYVINDPINIVDIDGLEPACVCSVACGGVLTIAVCTKIYTCINDAGQLYNKYPIWGLYFWPDKPFNVFGGFDCEDFVPEGFPPTILKGPSPPHC